MKPLHVIGWLVWVLIVLAVFAWMASEVFAQTPPPLPPTPKVKKKPLLAPTQGSGAAALLSRAVAPRAPIPPLTKTLIWDWTPNTNNPASNVVFVVRSVMTNTFIKPTRKWPVVAVTTNKTYTFTMDKSSKLVLFVVGSSNRITHMESAFPP